MGLEHAVVEIAVSVDLGAVPVDGGQRHVGQVKVDQAVVLLLLLSTISTSCASLEFLSEPG